jgi:hypothetical protein
MRHSLKTYIRAAGLVAFATALYGVIMWFAAPLFFLILNFNPEDSTPYRQIVTAAGCGAGWALANYELWRAGFWR